jgi:hypothetical protein
MQKLLLALAVLLGAALAQACPASARDQWVLMGTREVDLTLDQDRIDLTRAGGRFKALRLKARRSPILMSKVVVLYGDGRVHNEERRINLLTGERTRQIDRRAESRFVDLVDIFYVAMPDARAPRRHVTLEVWGLQDPAERRTRRPGAGAVAAGSPQVAPGGVPARTGEYKNGSTPSRQREVTVAVAPPPGPSAPASGPVMPGATPTPRKVTTIPITPPAAPARPVEPPRTTTPAPPPRVHVTEPAPERRTAGGVDSSERGEPRPAAPTPPSTTTAAASPPPAVPAPPNRCAALGISGRTGSACADYEAMIAALKIAPLAYNHPQSMYLTRRTEVTLVLGTDGQDPAKDLKGTPGRVVEGETRISRRMFAELKGAEFEIEPKGPQDRLIVLGQPTRWTWLVTPLEYGRDKTLKMELSARLEDEKGLLPPVSIRTFEARIDVDVMLWDWLLVQAKALEPLHAAIAAIAGVCSLLLFVLRRRWRSGS